MSWLKGLMTIFQVIKELLALVGKVQKVIEVKKSEAKDQGIADLKDAKTDEDRKNALKKITGNS